MCEQCSVDPNTVSKTVLLHLHGEEGQEGDTLPWPGTLTPGPETGSFASCSSCLVPVPFTRHSPCTPLPADLILPPFMSYWSPCFLLSFLTHHLCRDPSWPQRPSRPSPGSGPQCSPITTACLLTLHACVRATDLLLPSGSLRLLGRP